MGADAFFRFFTLSLFSRWRAQAGVVLLSTVLIFLFASTLFVSSSLRHSLQSALKSESDFTVQRIRGDHLLPVPMEWVDEIAALHGVDRVAPRVWGRYYTEPRGHYFLIVGIDLLEDQSQRALQKLIQGIDLRRFLQGDRMLVGPGAARWMREHFYRGSFSFLNPGGQFIKVTLDSILPRQSSLVADDMIVVPIETARKILGLREDEATDITFNVPNDDEWANVQNKVLAMHYDLRAVSKRESRAAYSRLFDFKGGFFLVLFLIVLSAFALILYQRYSQVYSREKRAIGILRALGWSIRDVLRLKLYETLSVVIAAFLLGTTLAYGYVFGLGAPLLRNIFLGSAEASTVPPLVPVMDFSVLATIFLLYGVTFLAAVIFPVWRIAVSDPKEAML